MVYPSLRKRKDKERKNRFSFTIVEFGKHFYAFVTQLFEPKQKYDIEKVYLNKSKLLQLFIHALTFKLLVTLHITAESLHTQTLSVNVHLAQQSFR